MSKNLSLESLTKKLKNVANTQDSIPMFSLWIIHHKLHYKLIVDTWLNILKSSSTKHRLTLFYLANDVIQSCRRKKADHFREYFATVLPEAIALLRDKTISPGVERVLNVWSSRKIYDIDFIDQLHAALLTNRTPDTLRQKLLAEYKPSSLVEKIEEFKKTEDLISTDEKQLKSINVDASSTDSIHKLKDKVGGEQYSKNFEESATNIERFIVQYEDLIEKRKQLIDELSQGVVFYGAQYHEAKIVVNAYQSFDDRVTKMKKLLDQVKLKFSPIIKDDVVTTEEDTVADMDMSDSDQELGSKPSKIVAVDTASRRPSRTNSTLTSRITPTTVNRPGMRGASTSSMFSNPTKISSPPPNLSIPTISNGAVTKTPVAAPQSRTSTPSASPPSPEGSPELNISSPPRYPSLESRIADLFSIGGKPGAPVSAAENTASDSDGELALNARKASPAKRNAGGAVAGLDKRAETWQNSIPVIGGNRGFSTQGGSFMGDGGQNQDGGSTPLQDEGNSDNEKTGFKCLDSALPPPSFTGDALSFLTKFMGQQTSTELSVAATQSGPTVSTAGAGSQSDVLQKLDIDWSSLQNITASVGKWPESTGLNQASSAQNGNAATSQVTNERDTDYRTGAGSNAVINPSSSNYALEFARQNSNDDLPRYPAANEEYVVEEEEILVEDDPRPVHLSNLKNIPTIPACQLSPPPRPPFESLPGPPGRKRPFDDDPGYGRVDRFDAPPRPVVNQNRRPGYPRMPMDGPPPVRRYGPGPGPRRGHHPGPRHSNPAMANVLEENRYYDMLYDELRPKFPRPPFRGRFRPRRPYR